jgi:hypothetical protein
VARRACAFPAAVRERAAALLQGAGG